MGQQVRPVYNGAGHWTHEGSIMIYKKGYRCDYELDVYTIGLDHGPTKVI